MYRKGIVPSSRWLIGKKLYLQGGKNDPIVMQKELETTKNFFLSFGVNMKFVLQESMEGTAPGHTMPSLVGSKAAKAYYQIGKSSRKHPFILRDSVGEMWRWIMPFNVKPMDRNW